MQTHKNFAAATVVTPPSPDDTGTSLVVTTGQGARFGVLPVDCVAMPPGLTPDQFYSQAEMVQITGISGDTLTIARHQQGSTARHIAANWIIADVWSALTLVSLDASAIVSGVLDIARLPSSLQALRFGSPLLDGHSYVRLDGIGSLASNASRIVANYQNFMHRVAGILSAPDCIDWGHSGAQLLSVADGSGAEVAGIGVAMKHLYPDQWYAQTSTAAARPTRPTSKGFAGLQVLCFMYNEVLRNMGNVSYGGATTTFLNHLITRIARGRACMVFESTSSTVTGTGFATTVLSGDTNFGELAPTGGISWSKTPTNGHTRVLQLPDELPLDATGHCQAHVTMVGPTNTGCLLSIGINGTDTTLVFKGSILGDLGYKAFTAGDFIVIGTDEIILGTTADGGITWTGCNRQSHGVSHLANAAVTMAANHAHADWSSSTAPGASGHAVTYVSGAGASSDGVYSTAVSKTPGFVTALFNLTAADAGLTIVLTTAGIVGNEYVGFDSWGLADPDPGVIALINQPDSSGVMAAAGSFFSGTVAANFNATLATAQALFDANVVIVDVATEIQDRFSATVQTAISSTGTATLHITPHNASRNELTQGSVIRVLGATGVETMKINGAITKTSGTDWSCPVQRNYDAAGAQASIPLGQGLMNRSWLSLDWVHPAGSGHNIYAAVVLNALMGLTRTIPQAVNSAALKVRRRRLRNGGYYPLVRGGTRTTIAAATGQEYAFLYEITERCSLAKLGVDVSIVSAGSGLLRAGARIDDGGQPGYLMGRLGTDGDLHAATGEVNATGFVPMQLGFVWFVFLVLTSAATLRGHASANLFPPEHPIPYATAPTGSGSLFPLVGWRSTSTALTDLTDAPPAGDVITQGGITVPICWWVPSLPPGD